MISDLRSFPSARWHLAMIGVLLALAMLPFLHSLGYPFVYDDRALVVENEHLRSLEPHLFLTGPSLSAHRLEWYRPVTLYSLALNYRLFGLEPFGYHLTNLLLHAVNVLLVYQIANRLGGKSAPFMAAGLFAVHAVHVEAVAPVSGRADLLATSFALALWHLSLGWRHLSLARLSLAAPALLAALLAKESALGAWPVASILASMAPGGKKREDSAGEESRRWLFLNAALVAAVAIYFALRWIATGALLAAADVRIRFIENPLSDASAPIRIATAFWVLARYLLLLIAPLQLSADYSYNQIPLVSSPSDPRFAATILVLIAIGISLRFAWRRNASGLLVLALLLLWLPVSNLPVTIGTIMAERLFYLPSVAFCLLAGQAASSLRGRTSSRVMVTAAALLIAAHVGRTVTRSLDWRSQEALFAATVRASSNSAKARFNYGSELYRTGRLAEAQRELDTALAIAPRYPEARSALAAILLQENDLEGAERELRRATEDEPSLASAWANLGMTLFRMGRDQESAAALERALDLQPGIPLAWVLRGAVAERLEGRARAIKYQRACELDPGFDGLAEQLAKLLREEGRGDEAERVVSGGRSR